MYFPLFKVCWKGKLNDGNEMLYLLPLRAYKKHYLVPHFGSGPTYAQYKFQCLQNFRKLQTLNIYRGILR